VVRISGGAVRLGIDAPPHMPVARQELREQIAANEAETDDEVASAVSD
jgi:carbon storage regulator CsrA